MRILCPCEGGNVRSGHLATLLKDWGHDALQAGVRWNTPETVGKLCNWAELITVAEPHMVERIHPAYREKVTLDFCVGPDRWGMPMYPDLDGDYIERIQRLVPKGPREMLPVEPFFVK